MQEINDVRKLGFRYIVQSISIIIILAIIVLAVSCWGNVEGIVSPLLVSVVFSLVINMADGIIWRYVAAGNPDFLPTFYTAVSGFRMLFALATLFGCYLAVGRNAMLEYCIVFMVYYFVLLIHHSLFFSKVSNSHFACGKDEAACRHNI